MRAPAAPQRPDKRAGGVSASKLQLWFSEGFALPQRPHGCREAVRRRVAMAGTRWCSLCDRYWAKRGLALQV